MTEERKESMVTEETTQEATSKPLPPRKTGVLHKINVALLYLRSSITFVLILMMVLPGILNIDFSFKTYCIIALALTIIRYVIDADVIETTIGWYVPFKEIKETNQHAAFDLIIGLCAGYIIECLIINIMLTYFLYIFFIVEISTVQIMLFAYIILVVYGNLGDTYRASFGQ